MKQFTWHVIKDSKELYDIKWALRNFLLVYSSRNLGNMGDLALPYDLLVLIIGFAMYSVM